VIAMEDIITQLQENQVKYLLNQKDFITPGMIISSWWTRIRRDRLYFSYGECKKASDWGNCSYQHCLTFRINNQNSAFWQCITACNQIYPLNNDVLRTVAEDIYGCEIFRWCGY
jgi:hypothetical protein